MPTNQTTTLGSRVAASLVQRAHIPITLPVVQMQEAAKREKEEKNERA